MSTFDRFGHPASSVICAGEAPERDDPAAAGRRQWREAAEEMDRLISPLQDPSVSAPIRAVDDVRNALATLGSPRDVERMALECVAYRAAAYVRSYGAARVAAVHDLCVALAELRALRGGDERLRTEPPEGTGP